MPLCNLIVFGMFSVIKLKRQGLDDGCFHPKQEYLLEDHLPTILNYLIRS